MAYAAAHVIPKTWADNVPGCPADIDWDATLAFRHHVWSWGLGVADAMDTAQRNMGLDPAATRELITRSAAEARSVGGRLVVGVNTDHVEDEQVSLDAVIDAYKEQLHFTEDAVGVVVDTFHVWWDPQVFAQIARAGVGGYIASYQVCDWATPLPADVLLARHFPGDGVVDFEAITRAVIAAGYTGDIEVEIFNQDIWDSPSTEVVARTVETFGASIGVHLPA